ncbi:hypothetical protein NDU88_005089 [Pleurodeles waltl]|uniref:Alkaline ceramidase n=1 Tax=Pleurodeles waltl TaxID=8319 RepID=A0AAV7KZN7_PLEWA|nr:hypothetical protein NDU88_005089 [Pleurodeles waltl]
MILVSPMRNSDHSYLLQAGSLPTNPALLQATYDVALNWVYSTGRSALNKISNVTFFIVAPLMMYLMHPYAKERTWAVHVFWPMLMVVGIFSAYYHMTLSYLGQLLDEISILWILAVGYSIWFPRPHFPNFIKDRRQFVSAVSVAACVSTLMSFAKPTVNAYVLNCVTFHIIYVLVLEMRKCTIPKIHRLAAMSVCWWLLAISCWLSDRLLCGFWRWINFCYLHSFWHVLISITVVHSITLFAYFDAVYEIPQCQPEIQYWPSNRCQFGLPYLAVHSNQKPKKSC